MVGSGVLVVGETPSLGRAIADLLVSEGIPTESTAPEDTGEVFRRLAPTHPIVIVACNGLYCRTGRQWLRGEIPAAHLVVVGTRDPFVNAARGVHYLGLPISPPLLLALVRRLQAGGSGPTSSPGVGHPGPSPPPPDPWGGPGERRAMAGHRSGIGASEPPGPAPPVEPGPP